MKRYGKQGPGEFYAPRQVRGVAVLTAEVIEQIEDLLAQGIDRSAAVGIEARHRGEGHAGGARGLVAMPTVILADEPTGNLDPHSSKLVLDSILRRRCFAGSQIAPGALCSGA